VCSSYFVDVILRKTKNSIWNGQTYLFSFCDVDSGRISFFQPLCLRVFVFYRVVHRICTKINIKTIHPDTLAFLEPQNWCLIYSYLFHGNYLVHIIVFIYFVSIFHQGKMSHIILILRNNFFSDRVWAPPNWWCV